MDKRKSKNLHNAVVFTVGHSTHKLAEMLKILKVYNIDEVIDVRTIPRSRANPRFNSLRLKVFLKRHEIAYKHMKALGGLRHPASNSINTYWRNASFRGFADYMGTPEFGKALSQLINSAEKHRLVLMCAEALPWRCHRSLIADALTIDGIAVMHIFSAMNSRKHTLNPSAQVKKGIIVYR